MRWPILNHLDNNILQSGRVVNICRKLAELRTAKTYDLTLRAPPSKWHIIVRGFPRLIGLPLSVPNGSTMNNKGTDDGEGEDELGEV